MFDLQTKREAELNSLSHRGTSSHGSLGRDLSPSALGFYEAHGNGAPTSTPSSSRPWMSHSPRETFLSLAKDTQSGEKQKSSYSAGTGGTIAAAPAVNALLVHRRLQCEHRVSSAQGQPGLQSQTPQGHVAVSRMGRDRGISRVQPRAACKGRSSATRDARAGCDTAPGQHTPCMSNPPPRAFIWLSFSTLAAYPRNGYINS